MWDVWALLLLAAAAAEDEGSECAAAGTASAAAPLPKQDAGSVLLSWRTLEKLAQLVAEVWEEEDWYVTAAAVVVCAVAAGDLLLRLYRRVRGCCDPARQRFLRWSQDGWGSAPPTEATCEPSDCSDSDY
eukprot:TRINITY_DN41545_c0_g1_i1.p1 TRINITY_DN41545_c0_g1~~TRINITY_DN41545_c0_g1_i1.p1  ORF type:complete len:150 (+),score=45.87 TRINITY_DN41545_c0_g1_i1:62-451(+)